MNLKELIMNKNEILVIKIKPGNEDADVHRLHDHLIEQKASGVVILPSWTEPVIVPRGLKVKVEKENERIRND